MEKIATVEAIGPDNLVVPPAPTFNVSSQPNVDSNTSQTVNVGPRPMPVDDKHEYVTGFRLATMVGSVALACFLMLLDTMVISTASLNK